MHPSSTPIHDAAGLSYHPKLKPVIGAVAPGSVAAAAGLAVGDEIRAINGQRISIIRGSWWRRSRRRPGNLWR